jgi:hypothetical protein
MPANTPTPDARRELEQLADEIPGIQQTLVANDPQLQQPDRGAHQQQLAGGRVTLRVTAPLPPELDGLGLFDLSGAAGAAGVASAAAGTREYIGLGRISTGLGCPHIETNPDFLGLMVAFRAPNGRRIDFITINDPTAPTNTPADFIALLKATADATGTSIPGGSAGTLDIGNVFASQVVLLASLARHAGFHAPSIAAHVTAQTSRTLRSSTAYQQYWTGIVRARDVLGKFTFVPTDNVNGPRGVSPGETYLSDDWKRRQAAGALEFDLYWIPFLSEEDTPLVDLMHPWREDHRVKVGRVTFPMIDPDARDSRLAALLVAEMGANQGNWMETPTSAPTDLPATEYTAARALVYRRSQRERHALADDTYAAYFDRGEIAADLAAELIRRYNQKRAAKHNVPDVGDLA